MPLALRRVAAQCRVVVDNDFAGDPDGILALAHHLLSPSNRVVAITSSFLNPRFGRRRRRPGRRRRTARLAAELLAELGLADPPPVSTGAEEPFGRAAAGPRRRTRSSPRAREEDELPLYVVCGGPLTNVAAALELDPGIAERLTLVWIGGSLDPEAFEYNRDTDPAAAEAVLGRARAGRPPVPAGDLPALRLRDRRARGRPPGDGAPGRVAVRAVLVAARVGAARRSLADRGQPAAAGHGAHRRDSSTRRPGGRRRACTPTWTCG